MYGVVPLNIEDFARLLLVVQYSACNSIDTRMILKMCILLQTQFVDRHDNNAGPRQSWWPTQLDSSPKEQQPHAYILCKIIVDIYSANTLQTSSMQIHCRHLLCKYIVDIYYANSLKPSSMQIHCGHLLCKYIEAICYANSLQTSTM